MGCHTPAFAESPTQCTPMWTAPLNVSFVFSCRVKSQTEVGAGLHGDMLMLTAH